MILRVNNIVKNFTKGFLGKKVNVLNGISFEVRRGEVYGIVGPNGAGKTTTFKCILGFINTDSGYVEILKDSISNYYLRNKIGYLPENPYFYEYLTGYELLKYMGSLHGMDNDYLKNRIDILLRKVNLSNSSNIQLRKYSKGMLQRIAIAQAIINDPELLIMDEPMSGLDPLGRREIIELILELRKEGKTVILSSHILADLEILCDRICFIFAGKVVSVGTVYELLNISGSEYEALIRKNKEYNVKFNEDNIKVLEDTDEYISINFNQQFKINVIQTILSNKLELISFHPKRESLDHVFEKHFQQTES